MERKKKKKEIRRKRMCLKFEGNKKKMFLKKSSIPLDLPGKKRGLTKKGEGKIEREENDFASRRKDSDQFGEQKISKSKCCFLTSPLLVAVFHF